ncbi:hypothetical protein DASC09_043930 [Saccharomycopsis crataegensis]|uniref:Uncharacterized protein n=1 Tax=Saccharomycopsis crataegensis TaxID=43959 RepID=A0AAV5QQ78_9ASCO|nr:hypothetical protein DASC09_043930 [Saccharomycopsis crataegensis]
MEAYSPLTRGKKLEDPNLLLVAKVNWSLQKGFIPIDKSTSEARIRENFESTNFKLSDADVKLLTHDEEILYLSSGGIQPQSNEGGFLFAFSMI